MNFSESLERDHDASMDPGSITFAVPLILNVSDRCFLECALKPLSWLSSVVCVLVWSGQTCCVPPSLVISNALRCSEAWEPLPAISHLFGLAVLWFSWARWFVCLPGRLRWDLAPAWASSPTWRVPSRQELFINTARSKPPRVTRHCCLSYTIKLTL